MGGSVTIRVRSIILVLVIALVAVVAYLVGSAHSDSASAAATPSGAVARTVTMTGKGDLTAVPDELTFHLSVVKTRDDVSTAMDASSATLQRILSALSKEGVERKDTQSTGLSIDPVYRYFNYAPPQITGYHVRQSLRVVVRDLRNGGKAVAGAIAAGGNDVRVSGIKLEVGDTDALLAKARDAAVASATDKAKQYAAATGQDLGDVLTLQEGHRAAKPRPLYQGYDSAALAGAMREPKAIPIRAGRQDVSVTVSIVWSLA